MYVKTEAINSHYVFIESNDNPIYMEEGGTPFGKYLAKCVERYPIYYHNRRKRLEKEFEKDMEGVFE